MFPARIVVLLVALSMPLRAVPLVDFARQTEQHLQSVKIQAATWGQELALRDLVRLQSAFSQVLHLLTAPAARDLKASVHDLSAARTRFRVSATMIGETQLLADVEKVEKRLLRVVDGFGGRALPAAERLANLELDGPDLGYDSPQDLLREVRGLRYGLDTLRNPWVGQSSLSWGSWGPGSAGSGAELRELGQAVADLEVACRGSYKNVLETERDFRRVLRTYDRVGPFQAHYDSLGWGNVSRIIARLQRFYDGLH